MGIRTCRTIIENKETLCCAAALSVAEAATLMREQKTGAIIIVADDGRLAGIFTERDALFRVIADDHDPHRTPVGEVMTANPTSIAPDQPFDRALALMYEGRFRRVPVVEDGRAIGLVSTEDATSEELEQFMYATIAEQQARNILL
ncbi:MAG: CBS domain-containing protein [Gammaproteobacteria bacterium]|nr:CBS domain-containing protein [Gammaproteobacteria bacterium]